MMIKDHLVSCHPHSTDLCHIRPWFWHLILMNEKMVMMMMMMAAIIEKNNVQIDNYCGGL